VGEGPAVDGRGEGFGGRGGTGVVAHGMHRPPGALHPMPSGNPRPVKRPHTHRAGPRKRSACRLWAGCSARAAEGPVGPGRPCSAVPAASFLMRGRGSRRGRERASERGEQRDTPTARDRGARQDGGPRVRVLSACAESGAPFAPCPAVWSGGPQPPCVPEPPGVAAPILRAVGTPPRAASPAQEEPLTAGPVARRGLRPRGPTARRRKPALRAPAAAGKRRWLRALPLQGISARSGLRRGGRTPRSRGPAAARGLRSPWSLRADGKPPSASPPPARGTPPAESPSRGGSSIRLRPLPRMGSPLPWSLRPHEAESASSSNPVLRTPCSRGSPVEKLRRGRLGLPRSPGEVPGGRHGCGEGQVCRWCAGDGLGSGNWWGGGKAWLPVGEEEGSPCAPQGPGPRTRAWRMASATGAPWPLGAMAGGSALRPVPRAPSAVFRAENGSGQLCCSRVQHGCTRGQRGCTGRRQSAGRSVRRGAAANG